MPLGSPDQKNLGHYIALAQVGMEMVIPIGIGAALDHYFKWSPWGIVGGAVFGLIGGISHLVALANRENPSDSSKPDRPS
jgi:F0F1-type ATP synthase assembly protein I